MKKVFSKQVGVSFVWCGSPVIIDKRDSWGDTAENLQRAPNGAFLKMKSKTEVSHLVQPNETKTAPVGWIPGNEEGLFDKCPIYLGDTIEPGQTVTIQTLDGEITYTSDELSVICANEENGEPSEKDRWVQKWTEVEKNYFV